MSEIADYTTLRSMLEKARRSLEDLARYLKVTEGCQVSDYTDERHIPYCDCYECNPRQKSGLELENERLRAEIGVLRAEIERLRAELSDTRDRLYRMTMRWADEIVRLKKVQWAARRLAWDVAAESRDRIQKYADAVGYNCHRCCRRHMAPVTDPLALWCQRCMKEATND